MNWLADLWIWANSPTPSGPIGALILAFAGLAGASFSAGWLFGLSQAEKEIIKYLERTFGE